MRTSLLDRVCPLFLDKMFYARYEKITFIWATYLERTDLQGFSIIVEISILKWLYFIFFFINSDKIILHFLKFNFDLEIFNERLPRKSAPPRGLKKL